MFNIGKRDLRAPFFASPLRKSACSELDFSSTFVFHYFLTKALRLRVTHRDSEAQSPLAVHQLARPAVLIKIAFPGKYLGRLSFSYSPM